MIVSGQSKGTTGKKLSEEEYRYNNFNQLTKVGGASGRVEYAYNADGLRVSKKAGGTTTSFTWDGTNIVMEGEGTNGTRSTYLRGLGLISRKAGVAASERYVKNGHGDVVQMLSGTGTAAARTYEYDAFGNEINPDPNDTNPFRFCSEYFDTETGYIYLRARYMNPSTGRFISQDPIRDGNNWYTYCHNDPINFFDPSGKKESRDESILTAGDYQKVLMLTAIYNWARDNGDNITMDAMRYQAVLIRQNSKYNGTAYGEPKANSSNTSAISFVGVTGYWDSYNYTSKTSMNMATAFFFGPYSHQIADEESGRAIAYLLDYGLPPDLNVGEKLEMAMFVMDLANITTGLTYESIIAGMNPLYNILKAGDYRVDVTRTYVQAAPIIKWRKSFYFHPGDSTPYYIKN